MWPRILTGLARALRASPKSSLGGAARLASAPPKVAARLAAQQAARRAAVQAVGPNLASRLVTRAAGLSNILWAGEALLSNLEARIKGSLPSFEHSIEVNVSGGPTATMKSIWDLAVSTALGRYRASVPGATGITLTGVWDYTNKMVGIRLIYENSGVLSYAIDQDPAAKQSAMTYIVKGPREETLGGEWKDFDATRFSPKLGIALDQLNLNQPVIKMGGLPAQAGVPNPNANIPEDLAAFPPILPDDNRLITTRAKGDYRVQPPAPTLDGSYMLRLVSNALTTPCYLPGTPPLGTVFQAPFAGLFAPADSTLLTKGTIRSNVNVNTEMQVKTDRIQAFDLGPDNYTAPDKYVPNPPYPTDAAIGH